MSDLASLVADWLDSDDVAENRAADEVRARRVEVNALAARIRPADDGLRARVEALADEWDQHAAHPRSIQPVRGTWANASLALRAALADPENEAPR